MHSACERLSVSTLESDVGVILGIKIYLQCVKGIPCLSILTSPPRLRTMAASFSIARENMVYGLPALILLVFIIRKVYSVYFGPLSKFPGQKLAAATLWYEFYYDVILRGNYTFKIQQLHRKYGMCRNVNSYHSI
jgi:hypothetical protein